jgi:GNAT superfamily N-acetyltransferase
MALGSAVVRPGGAEDVASVAALHRNSANGRDRLTDLTAAQVEGRLVVAERSREIVGYAIHGKFFEYDFVEVLIVRPSDRRTGVATALVAAIEGRSRSGKLFTSTNRSKRRCGNSASISASSRAASLKTSMKAIPRCSS